MNSTYSYIKDNLCGQTVVGFIDFSNGGFFLTRLVQIEKLNMPIICIGSSGYIDQSKYNNHLYLLIGKKDLAIYDQALALKKQSEKFCLDITLIEYDGGHELPKKPLLKLLKSLNK